MRSILLSLVLLIAAVPMLFGKIVEKNQAQLVATNFLNERIANHQVGWQPNSVVLTSITTREANGQPAFYVFSNQGQGFIIISADDRLVPVLGYSYTGSFPTASGSSNFDYMLQNFVDQVEYIRNQPEVTDQVIQAEWLQYSVVNGDHSVAATNDIGPLLTALWNQDNPYNDNCPADAAGPGGHVYSGCVATAMSMLMYYYRYPVHGTGTHSYNASGYGTQTVNYGTTYYDWDAMTDQLGSSSGQSIPSVAQLQYHAGVSVNMMYGSGSSGAYSTDVPAALISHFGYATTTQYVSRSSYNATTWENMVVEQLDALKPMYYSGVDPTPVTGGGHAWICDGYQVTGSTKMFHFNFGWSGYGNGFYTLANPNGFTTQQAMVRNAVPAISYPYGCSYTEITEPNGSFEDRSGPLMNYEPNSNCTWLIAPADSVSRITLTFVALDVDISDSLYLYDGDNANAPLLGAYSGTTLPAQVQSTGRKVFLQFITDGAAEGKGWEIEYHSTFPVYCSGTTVLTDGYGTLSDGSGQYHYNNNAVCKWKIQPLYATDLTLYFTNFNLSSDDELLVYSLSTSTTLMETLTGNQLPDPIISPTGGFLLIFKSDNYNASDGFDAYYTTSNVGITNLPGVTTMSISPNPARNFVVLRFSNNEILNGNISISDMAGRQLYSGSITANKGNFEKTINLEGYRPGMYFLTLTTDKGRVSEKLIVN